jgi:hypothetical protein
VDQEPRYAVFFVPAADSALYRFGSSILGYDCYTGLTVDRPIEFGAHLRDWIKLTEEPARYGFHATLKAPFRLLPTCTEAQLASAVQSFVGLVYALPMVKPAVQVVSGFAAIVAAEADPSLATLAASCTTIFDAFRAPITPQERARRIALGLNESQLQNLDRWGYPFVLSDYQFHMTLTGQIQGRRRAQTLAVIRQCFARMLGEQPFYVDRIALVKQQSPLAAFRVVSQVALRTAG